MHYCVYLLRHSVYKLYSLMYRIVKDGDFGYRFRNFPLMHLWYNNWEYENHGMTETFVSF